MNWPLKSPVAAAATITPTLLAPNTTAAPSLAQGSGSDLAVTWSAPVADNSHGAASGFALRWSPSGANTWTSLPNVTSPYDLSGLPAGTAIDVELQSSNSAGASAWSAASTLATASSGPFAPNAPAIGSVAPLPDGTNTKLLVIWNAPAPDETHGAATGYNARYSPQGAGTWTVVSGVASPLTLTGLSGATAYDVEIQGVNAAANPSAWSASTTATTWGATVGPGNWTAASTQVHGTPVAPNTGVQMVATPAPTSVTGAAFAWSTENSIVPATGLIAAESDGQDSGDGWGQWFSAPASAGTWYLWMLALGSGGTIGALVTPAITVT